MYLVVGKFSNVMHPFKCSSICYHCPTEHFTVLGTTNSLIHVSEILKIRRSTDFEAQKTVKYSARWGEESTKLAVVTSRLKLNWNKTSGQDFFQDLKKSSLIYYCIELLMFDKQSFPMRMPSSRVYKRNINGRGFPWTTCVSVLFCAFFKSWASGRNSENKRCCSFFALASILTFLWSAGVRSLCQAKDSKLERGVKCYHWQFFFVSITLNVKTSLKKEKKH